MLQIGDKAPDLLGVDEGGNEIRVSDYAGRKLVVYFYPKDNTPGCTRQACAFAGAYKQFEVYYQNVLANVKTATDAKDKIFATWEEYKAGVVTYEYEIRVNKAAYLATKFDLDEINELMAEENATEVDKQDCTNAIAVIGKTVEELKNGDIDMTTGKAKDGTDLQSSATIYLAGYVYAIEAAVNNAQHLGAQAGDELVLATMNKISSSTPATAEAEGNAQLDADIAVLTRKDGVITSCFIDAVQAKIAFDATGAITSDLTAPVQTKNELGENYGMVAWGGAIAEWDAQAAAFASYITGKTAADVAGIAVNEKTAPTDADLAASVTISIIGFMNLITKAAQ